MLTTLSRVIKYGLVGFWRNGWLSTATIAIVFLVLVGFGGLLMFNSLANIVLTDIQDKIDISVYFKLDAPEDRMLQLQRSLESLPEVKKVEYISRDKALETFKAQHKDDTTVSQALEAIDANPLAASLNIKARELKDYATIAGYVDKDTFREITDKVSYTQNIGVIDRLKKIKGTVEQGGLLLIVFISLIAALIIFNTIRLAIYSNREELSVMRLVGASNFFIRGPYMVEGIIYGVTGSIMSVIVVTIGVFYAAPYAKIFVPDINGWAYYLSNFFMFMSAQILFGVGLGVVSSYIAVKKYLKI
jgi:cell division transport system permease protein